MRKFFYFGLIISSILFSIQPIWASTDKLIFIGQDKDSIDDYVTSIGIVPSGFMVYSSIQNMEGLDNPSNYGAGIQDAQYLINKYPGTSIQIGLYMVNSLRVVLAGIYDKNIDKLANWIKDSKRQVYLRIGYEFDFPDNKYDPDLYQKAYQYIVDRLRANNVNNVSFVWHSFAATGNYPIDKWYPGDNYVDWCAVSYFSEVTTSMIRMVSFAKEHNKPLMIAEATPRVKSITLTDKSSWDDWFAPFFKFIFSNNVKAVCYINANWDAQPMWFGQNWGDSRVQNNETIKNNWIQSIQRESLSISSFTPTELTRNESKTFTIQGTGFEQNMKIISLADSGIATSCPVISSTTIDITITANVIAPLGNQIIRLKRIDGSYTDLTLKILPAPQKKAVVASNVYLAPNPYSLSQYTEPINFLHVKIYGTVKILSASGELVKELTNEGNSLTWDATNSEGIKIAPGTYVCYIETENGTKVQKLSVEN